MSTTIGAITSALPPSGVTKANSASPPVSSNNAATEGAASKPLSKSGSGPADGAGAGAITPVPIQPLSSRVLETFLQKDIELYGSTVGS
jgi:hypothetical protein